MKYKLLALDIDGTIVGENHKLPPENIAAIRAAVDKGVNVLLCSGRSYATIRGYVKQLRLTGSNTFAASFNGCLVHNTYNDEVVHELKLPRETALGIIEKLKSFPGVDPVVYWDTFGIYAYTNRTHADKYIVTCGATPTYLDDFSAITQNSIYKIIAIAENQVLKEVEAYYNGLNNDFTTCFTQNYFYEFFNKNSGKDVAVQKVCSILGIKMSEVIAVGDSGNDITMIKAAGLGIAMKNANDNVKAKADYITQNDVNNFGVKEVIEKFIL